MNEELLTLLSPNISHFVVYLVKEACLGICGSAVQITEAKTSCLTVVGKSHGKCDRFKVHIPYAGQTLIWEVLFDSAYPEEPPDIIFASEDQDFVPNIENIQSLVHWDYSDPGSLLHVLEELLFQYRLHQEQLISGSSRLQFEYTSLLEHTEVNSADVEIYVTRNEVRMGPINFLVKLPVDFINIPSYIAKINPGEDSAVLLVSFNTPDGSRVTPQLYLSPRVEHALGGSSTLRIPGFPGGGCLMDYVPDVTSLLKNKVDQTVQCFEKRKEYIAAFLSCYGRSVLEYDAEGFSKVSFLFEWNDFFFIIYIDLPPLFPLDQPCVSLQSIYHEFKWSEMKGRPYLETFSDYPYSPRWSGLEMAERTRQFVLEKIGSFQKASVLNGSM